MNFYRAHDFCRLALKDHKRKKTNLLGQYSDFIDLVM